MSLGIVDLPWPNRDLHPNERVHWARRARAAKSARQTAMWQAKAAGIYPISARALSVTAIFHPPDRRRRDEDGMVSSIKSYLDGIADAIGVDDSKWRLSHRREEPVKGGSVRVMIEEAA